MLDKRIQRAIQCYTVIILQVFLQVFESKRMVVTVKPFQNIDPAIGDPKVMVL